MDHHLNEEEELYSEAEARKEETINNSIFLSSLRGSLERVRYLVEVEVRRSLPVLGVEGSLKWETTLIESSTQSERLLGQHSVVLCLSWRTP
mgnify:CR=1 FL=1